MWETIVGRPMPHLCSVSLLLALAPVVNGQTTPQPGRIRACGNVLSVTCSPSASPLRSRLLDPTSRQLTRGHC
jgi:hypothetical protein